MKVLVALKLSKSASLSEYLSLIFASLSIKYGERISRRNEYKYFNRL